MAAAAAAVATAALSPSLIRPRSATKFLPGAASRSDLHTSFAVLSSRSEISTTDAPTRNPSNLPHPLTIADLAPAPLHGHRLRVAYQGVPGAYSEAAASKAYPDCTPIPCDQFEVAFQAVELWISDRAVLPVENSLGDSIHRNYDLLLRHRLHIIDEVQFPVHHCLLALPDVRKDVLTRVISHPQALAQCEQSLTDLILNVAREAFDDTLGADAYISTHQLHNTVAVASASATHLYNMHILMDGIQDNAGNVTRFLILHCYEQFSPHKSLSTEPI